MEKQDASKAWSQAPDTLHSTQKAKYLHPSAELRSMGGYTATSVKNLHPSKGKKSKHESDKLTLSSDLPAREAMVSCRENVAQGSCFTILALGCFFHLLEVIVLNFIIQMIHASLHHYLSLFAIASEENQGNLCSKTTCLYE